MRIRTKPLKGALLALLYLPLFVFFMGWCRPLVSVPCVSGLLFLLWDYRKRLKEENGGGVDSYEGEISILSFVFILVFALAVSLLAGYGHIFTQHYDWIKHNAILHDMTVRDWPVLYQAEGVEKMLSYYVGLYLVPAAIGKVLGGCWGAELVLGGYLFALLLIVFLLTVRYLSCRTIGRQAIVFALFFLFSGLFEPAHLMNGLMGCTGGVNMVVADLPNIHYLCFRIMPLTVGAYVQGLASLGIAALALIDRFDGKHIGFFLLPLLLFSPFACAGLFLLYLTVFLFRCLHKENVLKSLFSPSNFVCLALAAVLLLYLWGNISLEKPGNAGFALLQIRSFRNAMVYVLFCVFMFGLYYACLWHSFAKEDIFVANLAALCLIPLVTMGAYNDWCQGASISLMYVLFLYVMRFLLSSEGKWRRWLLLVVLGLGCWSSVKCIRVMLEEKTLCEESHTCDCLLSHWDDPDPLTRISYRYNYMSGNIYTDLFYQYFAK